MLHLGAYRLSTQLHQGTETAIYRGHRQGDDAPVVAKVLRIRLPTPLQLAKLRHEFALLRGLSHPHVVRVYELVEHGGGVALIMEDLGGLSLSQLLRTRELDLGEALDVALQLAHAVAAVHAAGLLHRDIKPSNFIIHPDALSVKLIDFGLAIRASDSTVVQPSEGTLEGTLAFMSPEQTGRTALAVDSRTDLYSLGLTLYQLFTRIHPFDCREPLELLHAQLARVPPPMHVLHPATPPHLSRIVAKLVEKDPDARYQTALGLAADLEELRARWRRNPADLEFPLARRDRIGRLRRPHRLHGRARDCHIALAELAAARHGGARLIAVSGPSGIGKSALLDHLVARFAAEGATCCVGKCDPVSHEAPYAPLAAALRDLVAQQVVLPEASFVGWRERLHNRGTGLRALFELVPELEQVAIACPPLHELGAFDAKARFHRAVRVLLDTSASPERPVVLVFDDLHWADPATFAVLCSLLGEPQGLPVCVIAAWPDEALVDPTQPLAAALAALLSEGAVVQVIPCGPLDLQDVRALVADMLSTEPAEVEPLVELVFPKTLGNPGFLEQLLKSIHDAGLLRLDRMRERWVWDEVAVGTVHEAGNVVELMLHRLRRLSPAVQAALQVAACLGHRFELGRLAEVLGAPVAEVAAALDEALRANLIAPAHGARLRVSDWLYRFPSDRMQQALAARIDEADRAQIHRRIAEALTPADPTSLDNERLFELLTHVNQATSLYSDVETRVRLARLNLLAGERARESVAFDAAVAYHRAGIALLGETGWGLDRRLRFELGHGMLACASLGGGHSDEDEELLALEGHVASPLEVARVHHLRLQRDIVRGRPREALDAGLRALAALGVELPRDEPASAVKVPEVMQAVRERMANVGLEALLSLPAIQTPEVALAVLILADLSSPTNLSHPALYSLVIATQAHLSLKHGHALISSYSYMVYAYHLATKHRAREEARQIGGFALALLDRWGAHEVECKTRFVYTCFAHLLAPLPEVVDQLAAALQAGRQSGDAVFMSYACSHLMLARLHLDERLGELRDAGESYLELIRKTRVASSLAVQQVAQQFIACLQGRTPRTDRLDSPGFDAEAFLAASQTQGLTFAVRWQLLAQLEALVLFGHEDLVLAALRAAEARLSGGLGFYFTTQLPLLGVLALALASGKAAAAERGRWRAEAVAYRAQLADWAAACPENYAAALALADAELARFDGNVSAALHAYESAVTLAQEGRRLSLAALALERAGLYCLEHGLSRPAVTYLRDACAAYHGWEALAKVRQLVDRYGALLREVRPQASELGDAWQTSAHSSSSTRDQLDLTTAFKGAQALASEMNLERLLAKVVPIAIENSGAERGVLALYDRDGELRPSTEFGAVRDVSAGALAMTVARTACRTGAAVVLSDASTHAGAFRDDGYLRQHRVRSLLCAPLIFQGQPLGVLYLENSLTAGVFTEYHTRIIHVLTTQAAIAIQNARLYAMLADANRDLEQRVLARTAELSHALEHLQAAQRQLVEAEKMAALGTLVAGVAHEINTPIGVSVTAASVLLERSDQVLESYRAERLTRRELERYVDHAHQSSALLLTNLNRAAALIQSFKQVAVDQSSEEARAFVVRTYIDHVLLSLRPELKRTRLRVEVEGDPELTFHSFPGVLSQILTNLIMNSLIHAYGPEQAGTLRIAFTAREGGLDLEYSDDGRGIDPDALGRIFDPFFTTRRERGGSGLGLHIVYNLTQRLGGAIRCESRPGRGARFCLFLGGSPTLP